MIGMLLLSNISYASVSSFEYMLNVMEIPPKNQNGYVINEEIFEKYQLFVYGSPEMIKENQRFKNVDEGRWNKNGMQGEYWILGENFHGISVHNPVFPYDMDLGINPRYWPYVEIQGGQASWDEMQKNSSPKQVEYMKTTFLSRNNTTYDFTAPEIGYSKTRVENVATWKTNGIIEVRKRDSSRGLLECHFLY